MRRRNQAPLRFCIDKCCVSPARRRPRECSTLLMMSREGQSRFHTTQWSLIAALPGQSGAADPRAREALRHLCEAYWRPLYAFARYSGCSADDAHDLTQAFLAKVIESGGLGGADPDRGRFRSYVLGAMKHFMANARQHENAQKRGGGRHVIPGDIAEVESRIVSSGSPATPEALDRVFDRDWAHETTAAAMRELASERSGRGKLEEFTLLRPALTGEISDRAATAERLGLTENALNVAIYRLRRRYAALVREAVARTVADHDDIEDEMRYLVSVLREK